MIEIRFYTQTIILDYIPLTLEEVFIYEMEALGYEFHSVKSIKINYLQGVDYDRKKKTLYFRGKRWSISVF